MMMAERIIWMLAYTTFGLLVAASLALAFESDMVGLMVMWGLVFLFWIICKVTEHER